LLRFFGKKEKTEALTQPEKTITVNIEKGLLLSATAAFFMMIQPFTREA
jgi:hypothetical protein